ncbi:hypothetical protein CEXT_152751 [Caerostris extrusa]|uniref:Uncharacterized protein n=1 Tax=Caerostris extrusa TaxID=172846 RepID=A0AAV4TD42_CAEEX|nr:hypothetical protein CEXT_152751 [Caerostris extrusa]
MGMREEGPSRSRESNVRIEALEQQSFKSDKDSFPRNAKTILKQTSQDLSEAISPLRRENLSDKTHLRLFSLFDILSGNAIDISLSIALPLPHPKQSKSPSLSKTMDDRAPRFIQGRNHGDGEEGLPRTRNRMFELKHWKFTEGHSCHTVFCLLLNPRRDVLVTAQTSSQTSRAE